MSKARPTTSTGRAKLSEEHRAKISAAAKGQWARMTPAEREAAMARIGRKPKDSPAPAPSTTAPVRERTASSAVSTPPPARSTSSDPPATGEGRRNPLAMTPRELIASLRGRRG